MEFKKIGSTLLVGAMAMGSVFAGLTSSADAATAYKCSLKPGVTCKYDLDGDKDKDSVKLYKTGDKIMLKVNKTTKKVMTNYSSDGMAYEGKIYDFNSKDKSAEVVVTIQQDDSSVTRIFKFKDNACKMDKTYNDAELNSYDSKTGMVTLMECQAGRYAKFSEAIGSFYCYDRVRVDGFKAYNQYTAYTPKDLQNNKYVMAKTMKAVKSPSSKTSVFTLKKGSNVGVYALYQKGGVRYVKVKNSAGKYGYLKASSSLLFTKNSCLWFR